MEYVFLGLLIIILIIGVISLFKNINEAHITDRLSNLEVNMTKSLGDFKSEIERNLNDDFNKLSDGVEKKLLDINGSKKDRYSIY